MALASSTRQLSPRVLSIPADEARMADPRKIMEGTGYHPFRYGRDNVIFIKGTTSQLGQEDIEALNAEADTSEFSKNRLVKSDIGGALSAHFRDKAIKVFEMGCGQYPIMPYLSDKMDATYHGIDRDKHCVDIVKDKGFDASGWNVLKAPGHEEGRTSICVSVYALHFMVQENIASRIKALTSDGGFFVGNFYSDPDEVRSHEQRDKLKDILTEKGMNFMTLADPECRANEYWIISAPGDQGEIHGFANALKSNILRNRNSGPTAAPV